MLHLAPYVRKITGLDANEGMLGKARTKVVEIDNVELVQGSILTLPFKDDTFDGVICNQVPE